MNIVATETKFTVEYPIKTLPGKKLRQFTYSGLMIGQFVKKKLVSMVRTVMTVLKLNNKKQICKTVNWKLNQHKSNIAYYGTKKPNSL